MSKEWILSHEGVIMDILKVKNSWFKETGFSFRLEKEPITDHGFPTVVMRITLYKGDTPIKVLCKVDCFHEELCYQSMLRHMAYGGLNELYDSVQKELGDAENIPIAPNGCPVGFQPPITILLKDSKAPEIIHRKIKANDTTGTDSESA